MKVLILGDGLLGSEIKKQTNWPFISRKKDGFDFETPETYVELLSEYDTILNCIAYTDTYTDNKSKLYNTNYKAVCDLSDICKNKNKKIVHISTDYVYAESKDNASEEDLPLISKNWYTYYKLLADEYIMLRNENHLICRCSFKEKPFKYDNAWIDLIGNFDYVDTIADLVIQLIKVDAKGLYNVGTDMKSIYEMAKKTNDQVKKCLKIKQAPSNITMNLQKLKFKLY